MQLKPSQLDTFAEAAIPGLRTLEFAGSGAREVWRRLQCDLPNGDRLLCRLRKRDVVLVLRCALLDLPSGQHLQSLYSYHHHTFLQTKVTPGGPMTSIPQRASNIGNMQCLLHLPRQVRVCCLCVASSRFDEGELTKECWIAHIAAHLEASRAVETRGAERCGAQSRPAAVSLREETSKHNVQSR